MAYKVENLCSLPFVAGFRERLLSLGQQTRLFCIIELPGHILVSHRWRFIFFIIWNIILKAFSHSLFRWYSEASCCTQVKHCEVQTLKLWPHWLLTFWSTAKDYWTIYMITWAVLAWKWTRWMETDPVHLDTIRCKLPMVGALKKCSSQEMFVVFSIFLLLNIYFCPLDNGII